MENTGYKPIRFNYTYNCAVNFYTAHCRDTLKQLLYEKSQLQQPEPNRK